MSLRTSVALALSAAALLLAAGPASAGETRVVSPSSERTASPCTTADPCRLDYAMGVSVSGDDVSLLPGDYLDPANKPWAVLPRLPAFTSIHPAAAGSRPVLHGHMTTDGSFLKLDGAKARDLVLALDTDGEFLELSGLHLVNNASAERIQVRVSSGSPNSIMASCHLEDSTKLVDSVCIGEGKQGNVQALEVGGFGEDETSTGELRNVTAVSTASTGAGMVARSHLGTAVIKATNVIARGRDGDIVLDPIYAGSKARLVIDHSNWGTIRSSGVGTREEQWGLGNQTVSAAAEPLFVDAAAGDYRQAPGSPTIDKGATVGNSPFDFAGDPRLIGARTDIGADEFFPPPTVTTDAATEVGERVATLNGTAEPNGDDAKVRFEYGETTAYGSTADAPSVRDDAGASPVAATLAGLKPGTTYHYRLLATTARGGTAAGADRTFRTAATVAAGAGAGAVASASVRVDGPGPRLAARPGLRADKPPRISAVRIAKRGGLRKITFTVSESATVTLEIKRAGRRAGRLTVGARAGRNSTRFRGRLAPGAYVLTVRARDAAGNASTPRRVRFRVARRSRAPRS